MGQVVEVFWFWKWAFALQIALNLGHGLSQFLGINQTIHGFFFLTYVRLVGNAKYKKFVNSQPY